MSTASPSPASPSPKTTSDPERRDHRRKRYLSLGMGELTATAVFVVGSIIAVLPRLHADETWVWWVALTPLIWILAQAAAYWLLARDWVGLRPMPLGLARAFEVLRWVNPLVLAAAAVLVVFSGARVGVIVAALLVIAFALIEHLNYHVVRLSYPLAVWFTTVTQWRTPQLRQDVTAALGAVESSSGPTSH